MVVRRVALRRSLLARVHPRQICGKPPAHSLPIRRAHRRLHPRRRSRHLHQMQRADHAIAPPRRAALVSLRVFQMRVHPRLGHDEPCPQPRRRRPRVFLLPGQHERRSQRRHLDAQPDHRLPVICEVRRIALPVDLLIRSTQVRRVRPEVVRLRKIIVHPARRLAGRNRRNRHRLPLHVDRSRPQHAPMIHPSHQRSRIAGRTRYRTHAHCNARRHPSPNELAPVHPYLHASYSLFTIHCL